MKLKIFIDAVMAILFIVLMTYRATDNLIHELIGVSLFLLIVIHVWLNKKWLTTFYKAKFNALRIFQIVTILLLFMVMLVMLVNVAFISQGVFAFKGLDGSLLVRKIHVFSANWIMILSAVHLGSQWHKITGFLNLRLNIPVWGKNPIAFGIFLWGAKSFIQRNISDKLIMYYSYDFNLQETTLDILLDYFLIILMFTVVTVFVINSLKLKMKNKLK